MTLTHSTHCSKQRNTLENYYFKFFHQLLSSSNGTTARGGPRPPSRVSSILSGFRRLLSNFYILALLLFLHSVFPAQPGSTSGGFPPGSLRRTLLAKLSSSWRMTCPALLSLQNFTMSFSSYN